MAKMTRVTFSDDAVDVKLPESWGDLTQEELRYVCRLMCSTSRELVPTYLFRYLSGMRVMAGNGREYVIKIGKKWLTVTVEQMASLLSPLSFLDDPGARPVRPDRLHGRAAVDAQLHGVSFGDYLRLENAWQAWLRSGAKQALESLFDILYPSRSRRRSRCPRLRAWEEYALCLWMSQIKAMMSSMFRNFFRPASGGDSAPASALENMNNQLRALTEGDLSKERQILESDCWRALTELDYKAKETQEMKRNMKS